MSCPPFSQWPQKLSENFEAQISRLADQFVGLLTNIGHILGPAVCLEVRDKIRQAQPLIDQALVQFQMTLQPVGAMAVSKSLIFTAFRPGQVHGAFRQVKCIAVPLENRMRLEQGAEKWIGG